MRIVKIKPAPKKKINKTTSYHYWLAVEQPKKKGRLAQLTKYNTRIRMTRKVSEFITLVKDLEEKSPASALLQAR